MSPSKMILVTGTVVLDIFYEYFWSFRKRFSFDPCSQINTNNEPVTVRIEAYKTNTL